jgi:hypothetical protein
MGEERRSVKLTKDRAIKAKLGTGFPYWEEKRRSRP